MRRNAISLVVALATLATGLMALTAPALAQVGYPPGPHTPVVSQTLPPAPPPARVQSAVAFTGADILRWAVLALVLVGIGTLLVAANRRSRATP